MNEQIIPIQDRAQSVAGAAELVGHMAAAVGVLGAAAGQLPVRTPGTALLFAVECAAGAALAVVIVREARQRFRKRREERAHGRNWVSLFAGAVLLLDWYLGVSGGGKIISPSLVAAGIAFMQPRLDALARRHRALRITGDGLDLRLGRLRRVHARWRDVLRVEASGTELRLVLTDGGVRRISLRRVINREQVVRAALEAGRVHASASTGAAVLARGA
ncbi:hypothetical protein [Longimicrobium terrae]|uniref:DUF304 domain-containing protein n=1 Tax=Longimicrobium terrae TaxID=1639882 RepID=A0A841GXS0_9BACT|nr:hypothetical protein [Longimicrobium terrae]MBB4636155.1 hypothetical protein [Longimicrobium terrae]MBB6070550.1 hypothetical protein [Longimicrobium terrae]NNC29536.1 hypothetical protein [Longimicrobium terrae]